MAFALFYNQQDMTVVDAILRDANLRYDSNADRNLLNACWSGGLSVWRTAPVAAEPYASGDPDCRLLLVDARVQGQPVTLAQMCEAFRRTRITNIATDLAAFLVTIAWDAQYAGGGKDPWP